jgi:hypothetical protein
MWQEMSGVISVVDTKATNMLLPYPFVSPSRVGTEEEHDNFIRVKLPMNRST